MSKVCLVLEGGGTRGAYTSGVLDAFLDNDININNVYGVSAGALNAMSYMSKQKGRGLSIIKQVATNDDCVNYKRFLKGDSIVNLDPLFTSKIDQIEDFDLEEFNKNEKFVVACTNVVTGMTIYKEITDFNLEWPYIKASASLPLFSKIVEVDGFKLLDGGISDSIPVLQALNDGYDKVIVVLTRDKEFVCPPYKLMSLYKTVFFKYPKFTKSMANRHNKYNVVRDLIVEKEEEGKVLAIYPSEKLVIKRLEKDETKIEEIYQIGYKDGIEMIKKVKNFIEGKKDEKTRGQKR